MSSRFEKVLIIALLLASEPGFSQVIRNNNIAAVDFRSSIPPIINDYTPVLGFEVCNNGLVVVDATAFNAGDTVLLIQMKGAKIDSTNTASFGTPLNYNNAGNYEFNYVRRINGNTIELENNLTRLYNIPEGKVQLVRVPYFENANFSSTITCLPWNGETGGVIAFEVRDTLTLNANIDASGMGFRGGTGINTLVNSANCGQTAFALPNSSILAAQKGESISIISNNIFKGRGANANGGGGGNDHNSGGGGGGNGAAGGSGGYQWTDCTSFIDNRGVGGKSLPYSSAANKLFLGGGGGAGHCNNLGFNSSGGNGGGIVIIKARKVVSNNHQIVSNGANAVECVRNGNFGYCHEGMGGGGGGGTVLLDVGQFIDNGIVHAAGGKGGNMNGENVGSLGPGGGGGGGVIGFTSGAQPSNTTLNLSGGSNGVNIAVSNNPNGAAPGEPGMMLLNMVLPIDTNKFFPNIDSVQITSEQTSCTNFNFTANGFTRDHSILFYSWNFGNGNVGSSVTSSQSYSPGDFNVRLIGTDINGCQDSTALQIHVREAQVNAGPDQAFCNSVSITAQLNATGNGSITWSASPSLSSTTVNNPMATITSTTTFYAHVTAAPSCTATDSVKIIINAATTSTTSNSVCSGDLPFLWNGQSFNSAGNYQVNLINAAGCDSVARLNLLVQPSAVSSTNQAICSSGSPFIWNGQSLSASGIYNANLVAANGCDSIATLNLTVQPTRTSNTSANVCRSALPYLWNGQSYTSSGNHSVNLTSSTGCDSVASLLLTINENVATNIRRQICPAQLPYSWNGHTINNNGIFVANLTSAAGCDSVVTLDLEVAPNLTSSIASAVCNSAFPYNWNGINITAPGNYAATLQSIAGCDSVVTVTVSALASQPVQTNPVYTFCEGTPLVVTASPGYSGYHWSPGHLVSDSTAQNPNYNGGAGGQQMIVKAVDGNGCISADTTLITQRPNPVVRTNADTSLCHLQQTTLRATGATAFSWLPFNQLSSNNSPNTIFTAGSSQTIYLTGTDVFGCIGRDTIHLEVKAAANLVAPQGASVCSKDFVMLNGANGNAYLYLWSPPASLSSTTIENPVASPGSTTLYSVRVSDTVCNFYRDFPVQVTVKPLPVVAITKSNDINCAQRSATLTASGATSFQWQYHPTLTAGGSGVATVRPSSPMVYTVTGIGSNGCKNIDTIKVNVLKGNAYYNIPNAFTPNGDGLNDCFGIKHWGEATNALFRIYNRYGELVFETTQVSECWNGHYKGKPADPGNYVFIAIADSPCGKMEKKGNVLLIR